MDRKIKWKPLLLSVAAALAAGGIGAWLGGDFGQRYGQMYVLMGIAAWQVWQSEASPPRRKRALRL